MQWMTHWVEVSFHHSLLHFICLESCRSLPVDHKTLPHPPHCATLTTLCHAYHTVPHPEHVTRDMPTFCSFPQDENITATKPDRSGVRSERTHHTEPGVLEEMASKCKTTKPRNFISSGYPGTTLGGKEEDEEEVEVWRRKSWR